MVAGFREVEEVGEKEEIEMPLLTRLFRAFLTGFCLWLMAVAMGAASAIAAGVSCDDWNTQTFFDGR